MLRRQALLRFIERRRLSLSVGESLHRTNGVALIQIGGGVLQRLNPVACEDRRVFLGAALGSGNYPAPRFFERRHRSATRAGGVDNQLPPRGNVIAEVGEVLRSNVRTNQVELVVASIVRSMPDQDEHKIVLGPRIMSNGGKRLR